MNRDQKKDKRRRVRQAAKERELRKAQEIEEIEPDEELDVLETAETEEPEVSEKDLVYPYDGSPSYYENSMPAPISFAELDEMEQAEEEAAAVRKVTYDTQCLVGNILRNPDMEPAEKVEAISTVAGEFGARVSTEEDEDVKKDIDVLQLEAIIAHDRRNTSASEFIGDMITKAVLTSARRNSLEDSSFALVVNRKGDKVRKYPIHDKAHVRNALARAAQMIKRGGQAASDAKAALARIHAAAKKMGIGSSMEKERNAILIEKDASDQWRWVGWVSNNFIDWDGDIITEDAHKEYVEWWEKNQDVSPVFVSWHTPGTARVSPVDFVMYENGFLIMSGKLQEEEAAGLLKAQAKTDLGMSHGTFVFSRDPADPRAITKYRMYEACDLPLDNAANPFTDFETIVKEVGMDKKDYLAQILGSVEKAEAFLEKTGLKQKALQEAQVESKEKTEAPPAEPVTGEPPPEPVAPVVGDAPETKPEDIVAQVMKQMDVDGLNAFVLQAKEAMEKVPMLEALIKDLQGKEEDKLAEKLTPPAARFAWTKENRASLSEDNVVSGEEKKKNQPGVPEGYWLNEATGTTPVAVEQ